jgi:hypothetical protein
VWTLWNTEKYIVPAENKTPAIQSVAISAPTTRGADKSLALSRKQQATGLKKMYLHIPL